jgi:hypothetical protein
MGHDLPAGRWGPQIITNYLKYGYIYEQSWQVSRSVRINVSAFENVTAAGETFLEFLSWLYRRIVGEKMV